MCGGGAEVRVILVLTYAHPIHFTMPFNQTRMDSDFWYIAQKLGYPVAKQLLDKAMGRYGGGGSRLATKSLGYKGKFKKPRRAKNTKHQTSFTTEFGSFLEQGTVIYVGHGIAPERILLSLCYAITRKLFNKVGHQISSMQSNFRGDNAHNWSDAADRQLMLVLCYRTNVQNAMKSDATTLTTALFTYADVADKLRERIEALSTGLQEQFILSAVELRTLNGTGPTTYFQPEAIVRTDNAFIKMSCYSEMTVQNQSVGTAATDDQITDVTNNPLQGKLFETSRPGFQLRNWQQVPDTATAGVLDTQNSVGNTNNFWPTYQGGAISFNYDAAGGLDYSNQIKNTLRRPPSASAWAGRVKQSNVNIDPGAIKKTSFTWTGTMSVTTFLNKMAPFLQNHASATIPFNLGKAQLFSFEKTCKTGQQAEQELKVGYEIQQTYRCSLFSSKMSCTTDHLA